jgi:hypothetical protein
MGEFPVYENYITCNNARTFSEMQYGNVKLCIRVDKKEYCSLNKLTGEEDVIDKEFIGNKSFDCKGFETL